MSKTETILVVDDDAAMRDHLSSILTPEGYSVLAVGSGQECIAQATALRPDLILLDLRMPGMDGVAVCKAIRADKAIANLPILIFTGSLSLEQIEESMTAGADDFVTKPIDVRDLLMRVHAILKWKHLDDPVERLQHYVETIRELGEKTPPADNS